MSSSAREVRKTVTILFCDLVHSTGLAEGDPEAYRRVQTRFFERMRAIVEAHGGTVEKFIGDEVMAVFGVPVVHEDDALRAVRAAQAMQHALPELGLEARIGINTGEVLAGDPEQGLGFVAGEAVIVAKRLEQGASAGEIIIGKATYPLVQHAVTAGPLERIAAQGKAGGSRVAGASTRSTWRRRAARAASTSRSSGARTSSSCSTRRFERAVRQRSCRLFTVLGPAGIGKSRLAGELATELEPRAHHRRRPLPPLRRRNHLLAADRDPRCARETSPSHWARTRLRCMRLLDGLTGASDAAGSSEEAFWAVRRALEACARQRPLVVCFEDLHWAEPTLLDLVEYLVGWSRNAPILVVCLARPELVERRPTLIAPRSTLGRARARSAVDRGDGEPAGSSSAKSSTRTRESGSRGRRGEPALRRADGGDDGRARRRIVADVPPTIHALLGERLDRLTPSERAVIERASVIGRDFSLAAVAVSAARRATGSSLDRHLLVARSQGLRPARSAFQR